MPAANRPVVNVIAETDGSAVGTVALPAVFNAPIRTDVVQFVHKCMNKNKRQAYAVSTKAGHQTSAESWGTGRAVARIPRVSGGGTHRAGQAAFGNMCRGGRMFAPTKIWRKWHVKINVNQKRYATASALAASAVPSLVTARGHRITEISEVPLVVSDNIQQFTSTKQAVAFLKAIHAYEDVAKVANNVTIRAGHGKLRNRRYRQRRGPLVVYNEDQGLVKAFRNVPGIDLVQVSSLNVLQLAPGGHMGRFVIWTQSAFSLLDQLYGSLEQRSALKTGYEMPRSMLTNADIARIIDSDEIQSVLRIPASALPSTTLPRKVNPLRNKEAMHRLNPYAKVQREAAAKGVAKEKKSGKRASKSFVEMIKAD
ncbi:60S ribosomal protein L4B [Dimargaris xerosporica]|nr:60S ribosomal protein L4B [Dimargaris xerosporica]